MTEHAMILAMAKAIYCADEDINAADNEAFLHHWFTPDYGDPLWEPSIYETYTKMARAALTSLLEPSSDMLEAGVDNLFGAANDDWSIDAREIFTAMIRTALTDTHAHRIINTGGE